MTVRTADLRDLWFFLDRGLGSVVVPGALRARRWQLTSMDERYGPERSQYVGDGRVDRRGRTPRRGTAVQGQGHRSGPAEAMAVYFNDARVFTLAHAGVTGPDMADLFLAGASDRPDGVSRHWAVRRLGLPGRPPPPAARVPGSLTGRPNYGDAPRRNLPRSESGQHQ